MTLPFVKLEGLGNDFLLFDGVEEEFPPALTDEAVVRRLCARRFGVGADGLLLLSAAPAPARARMRVLNADGSEPEMCGNGLRCVARYLVDTGRAPRGHHFVVATAAGERGCVVDAAGLVEVEMGFPSFEPEQIGLRDDERWLDRALACDEHHFAASALSLGNPHLVLFVPPDGGSLEALARSFGPRLERHERFPRRVNVEFARVTGGSSIDVAVWERGSGLTLACGTGACAVAVAAILTRRVPPGDVEVTLPGGSLSIHFDPRTDAVTMRGPAHEVYRGSVSLP